MAKLKIDGEIETLKNELDEMKLTLINLRKRERKQTNNQEKKEAREARAAEAKEAKGQEETRR